MYTEGVDEFNDAENRPPRTYVSTGGQDSLKLQRENERLKKSLEKEQFFNRLLDQELKELKGSPDNGSAGYTENRSVSGVSRSSFNILLIVTIALAGFIAYTLLYNKQYNLFPQAISKSEMPEIRSADPVPVVTDSVPNIISKRKAGLPAISSVQQQNTNVPAQSAAAATRESRSKAKPQPVQTDESAVPDNTVASNNTDTRSQAKEPDAVAAQPATTQPVTTQPAATQPVAAASQQASAPAPASRSAVGKYVVTSKANFYSAPDENTLRSYFISPGNDKVVNALEDKNGFIYVEFRNDVGYVTKGWLSKADLTKQ